MSLFSPQMSTKQTVFFLRKLESMYHAGIPIRRTFRAMECKGFIMRRVVAEMAAAVQGGASLESAFRPHANRFPPLVVEMIAVGEQSGTLEPVLAGLAQFHEDKLKAQRAFMVGLVYPISVLFVAWFIIPILKHAMFFIDFDGRDTAEFSFGLFLPLLKTLVLLLVLGQLGVFRLIKRHVLVHLWPFSALHGRFAMSYFLRALAFMTDAGLNLPESIARAAVVTGVPATGRDLRRAIPAIQSGATLYEAFAQCRSMPRMALEMLNVGEQSGKIGASLNHSADRLNKEALHAIWIMARCEAGIVIMIVAAMIFG